MSHAGGQPNGTPASQVGGSAEGGRADAPGTEAGGLSAPLAGAGGGALGAGGVDASGGASERGAGGASERGAGGASERGAGGAGGAVEHGGAGSGKGGGNAAGIAGAGQSVAGDSGQAPAAYVHCVDPLTVLDTSRLVASESTAPYQVQGRSAVALRQSLNLGRPDGGDAYTDWQIAWQFSNCASPRWTVKLAVTYTVPEWQAPADADAGLVASWKSYLDALWCHEYGHTEHGIQAANAALDAFQALTTRGDCNAIQAAGQQAFQGVLDDYHARDRAYDVDTNHGMNTGAVFPPQ